MCEGLLEESDGEGEPCGDAGPEAAARAGEAEASPTPARPAAAMEKKTEQQRRREKAAHMLVSAGPGCLFLPLPHVTLQPPCAVGG